MKQETFMMIKPDAYANYSAEKIKDVLKQHGFTIEQEVEIDVDMKVMQTLLMHYQEVIDRLGPSFDFPGKLFQTFYFNGPHTICPMRVSYKHDIIQDSRKLIGSTNPQQAEEGTIRSMFSDDSYEKADAEHRLIHNCIHASDSLLNAQKELELWKEYFK